MIVPVYRNQGSIDQLVTMLAELQQSRSRDLEVVFVIDGSPDQSREILEERLQSGVLRAQVIDLARNFGSFSAIRSGLACARGDLIAVMAADLQDPITAIEEYFNRLETGRCDIVVGRRLTRKDSPIDSLLSRLYWKIYRKFVLPDLPPGGVDSFGCSRKVADVLNRFDERQTSLVGLLYWIGFRREEVEYDRGPRHSGRSGWTFRRKLAYLSDSIFSFSDLPLRIVQIIGFAGTTMSVLVGLVIGLAWAFGAISNPGYTPIMLAILGSSSMILSALGVIGSYVWRAYENSKHRPVTIQSDRRFFRAEVMESSRIEKES